MFPLRRRRGRSAFARGRNDRPWLPIAAAALALVVGFILLMRQADLLAPEPHEIRIELPDAFKD